LVILFQKKERDISRYLSSARAPVCPDIPETAVPDLWPVIRPGGWGESGRSDRTSAKRWWAGCSPSKNRSGLFDLRLVFKPEGGEESTRVLRRRMHPGRVPPPTRTPLFQIDLIL